MPVSNPSYFPDQRGNGSIVGITAGQISTSANSFLAGTNAGRGSTADDLIIIGNGSGAAGIIGPDLVGSIMIGVGVAPLITAGAGSGFPLTIIGSNNLAGFTTPIDSTVVIGSGNLNAPSGAQLTGSVYIGNNLFPGGFVAVASSKAVVIGFNVGTADTTSPLEESECINSTLIGTDLFTEFFAGQYDNGVYIGNAMDFPQTGIGLSNSFNIMIGSGIAVPLAGTNISIGNGGYFNTGGANNAQANLCIGHGAHYSGDSNVILGAGATNAHIASDGNFGCVVIGTNAGQTIVGTSLTNILLVESATTASGAGAVASALLYGSFLTGNLILGDSTVAGGNRDLQGTNTVKLLNGTMGGVAPVGGGYFYVVAGALHWVGSAGSDTVVAPA